MQQYEICKLIEKFATTIKCTAERQKRVYWLYNGADKLWHRCLGMSDLFVEMVKILRVLCRKALEQHKITKDTYDKAICEGNKGKFWSGCIKFLTPPIDQHFETTLNMNHPYLPISGGKKINMENLRITNRTKQDYWTFEFAGKFLPDLTPEQNIFAKFLHELLGEPDEYAHFRLILGYMVTLETNQDMFLVVTSEQGGSGKTTLFETIKAAVPEFWSTIHKDILMGGKGNYSAEMCKIAKRRIVIMDEGAPNSKTNKNIDLSNILRLTGGVSSAYRDNYQKGIDVKTQQPTVKLVAVTNEICLDSSMKAALNRRMIYVPIRVWFRSEDDDDMLKPGEVQNEYLRRSNKNIGKHLKSHIDHAFTFLIKAANAYLNRGTIELVANQPQRWKHEWANSSFTTSKENRILLQYIRDECIYNKKGCVNLNEFQEGLKCYSIQKFNFKSNWTYEKYLQPFIVNYGRQYGLKMNWSPRGINGIMLKKNTLDSTVLQREPED